MTTAVCVLITDERVADIAVSAEAEDPTPASEMPAAARPHVPALVKTEVNFLRFPLFALHTKGLKALDGIECRGRLTRNGQTQEYVLRCTRNTASLYPGPLSRRVHFALLSIAAERGFPLSNPVTWSWRELCHRMGISYGGRTTLQQLKAAIRATHGIVLHSQQALFSKATNQPLPSLERGYHLYADFAFRNEPLLNGGTADHNAIWFADWYLENLNALYSAPLDYAMWQALDQRSTIASRLYEFLFLNFHANLPALRINYPTLAQLLPVRPEKYLSLARVQMEPALQILVDANILASFDWEKSRQRLLQLHFRPGQRLLTKGRAIPATAMFTGEDDTDKLVVKELRNSRPPEWHLVRDFYHRWADDRMTQPTPKELEQARQLIAQFGPTKSKAIIPLAIKHMKTHWPDAKTFAAVIRYVPEVAAVLDKQQKRQQRIHEQERRLAAEKDAAAKKVEEQAALLNFWQQLPLEERSRIEAEVLANQPPSLAKHPKMVERLCLLHLADAYTQMNADNHNKP